MRGGLKVSAQMTLHEALRRSWLVVSHLVDDVEPDRISTVAPMSATGSRVRPFCHPRGVELSRETDYSGGV